MGNGLRFAELTAENTAGADIARLAEIAAAAPDPWSREDFARVLAGKNHRLFAAFEGGAGKEDEEGRGAGGAGGAGAAGAAVSAQGSSIIAFAAFCALPESETADLELVAVFANKRRKGAAKALLCHAFAALAQSGVRQVLLEMRVSNTAAAALYTALGAKTIARRPAMYSRPPEDGVLMGITLQGKERIHENFGN